MKKLITVVLFLILTSCGEDPHDILLSEGVMKDKETIALIKELPIDERKVIARYMIRKAFNGEAEILTVKEALDEQGIFEEARKVKREEAAALKRQIDAINKASAKKLQGTILVSVLSKEFIKEDYKKFNRMNIAFQNKGGKDISGLQGKVIFYNMFGDFITSRNINYIGDIRSASTLSGQYDFKYNQFNDDDNALKNLDLTKAKIDFEATKIMFTDGTQLP